MERADWLIPGRFGRRPVVVVEDHLAHLSELVAAIAADCPRLAASLTLVCVDRPGPDTDRAVDDWLDALPAVQVVAATEPVAARVEPLRPDALEAQSAYCSTIARCVRPGGLLVQDVQLGTLRFISAERWWESIYLASTVRGMLSQRPPSCRFISNKQGYEATFGRDLVEAGFDARDVIDKRELHQVVVPTLRAALDAGFPLDLTFVTADGEHGASVVGDDAAARAEVEANLDLVLWPWRDGTVELGGRALEVAGERRCLSVRGDSPEAVTWGELVNGRLDGDAGVGVLEVGARVAPAGAGRAESTNAAARHIHTLRGRLADRAAIVTADHAYRLSASLAVGRATRR